MLRSNPVLPISLLTLLIGATLRVTPAFSAALPVTLFGQPCQLEGELPREQLQQIHSISPEQVPPAQDEKSAKGAIERLQKATLLPPSLERYREKALRHFEAWLSFHRGFEQSRKAGNADAFILATRNHLLPQASQRFLGRSEFHAKSSPLPNGWNDSLRDKLQHAFESSIAARPDEDFHGALQLLGIRYDCAFDRTPGPARPDSKSEAPSEQTGSP